MDNAAEDTDLLASTIRQANALIGHIIELHAKAEAEAASAVAASATANSESGFAYNAQQYAEEHAAAVSKIKGTVEADFNWLSQTKLLGRDKHASDR